MRGSFITLVLMGVMALGAAPAGVAAEDPEASELRLQAEAFWRARESEDWAKLYGMLSHEDLSEASLEQFAERKQQREKLRYALIAIEGVEVDGDLGWVDVTYSYLPKGFEGLPPKQERIWDVWRVENGLWRPLSPRPAMEAPKLPPILRSRDDEATLADRVHQFWRARESQDWAGIYGLLEPAYRDRHSEEEFLGMRAKYLYLTHDVTWIEVAKGSASGRGLVRYSYKINDPNVSKMAPQETVAREEWLKVDGVWFKRMGTPAVAAGDRTENRQ